MDQKALDTMLQGEVPEKVKRIFHYDCVNDYNSGAEQSGAERQHAAMRRLVVEQLAIATAPAGIAEGRSGTRPLQRDSPLCVFMEHKALFTAEIAGSAPLLLYGLPLSPSHDLVVLRD
ncbi:hypothetical protein A2U01_0018670, partial [Trifolium medium]|nr:hypothetical protein [Trifolium medium]